MVEVGTLIKNDRDFSVMATDRNNAYDSEFHHAFFVFHPAFGSPAF